MIPSQSANADIAQLVEQVIRNDQVVGSNPTIGSISNRSGGGVAVKSNSSGYPGQESRRTATETISKARNPATATAGAETQGVKILVPLKEAYVFSVHVAIVPRPRRRRRRLRIEGFTKVEEARTEKATGESFARTTPKNSRGRPRRRGRLGRDAKQAQRGPREQSVAPPVRGSRVVSIRW